MNFDELVSYKPKRPFKIVEKQLELHPEMKKKTYFTEEDMRVDYSKERLHRGEIEIPVFRDQTIRPLNFKGKLLDYKIENKGAGFYIITQKRGKLYPKPNDRRYSSEEIDLNNGGIVTFYITYDHKTDTYKYLEKEKDFLACYEEIETLRNGEEIQTLINQFIDWIQSFWNAAYQTKHHFRTSTREQNYQDYLHLIHDLEHDLPLVKKYHLLLNIFGDICDGTYKAILENLALLEQKMTKAKHHIHTHYQDPSQQINHHKDPLHGKPLTNMQFHLEHYIMNRGYFVDREAQTAYRNIAEIFHGEQFATDFESENSRKEEVQEALKKALENPSTTFFHL